MTHKQLQSVMKFQLKYFNNSETKITDETVHRQILSRQDGFGYANSKYIYRAVIRWTIIQNKHKDKNWPKHWIDLSVKELALKILDAE